MRSTMRWTVVDDLMMCVTSGEPDAAMLARFLDDLRAKPIRRLLATPFTISDEFADERRACGEICAAKQLQVALLVESSLASQYAFIASLSHSTIAAFSWDEVNAALAHLGVVGPAATSALAALRVAGERLAA